MKRWSAALALALCWSSRAEAQTSSDMARSKALFHAGATAYAEGDYLAAIQALDAAYVLTPLPAIAFSLAQAERKEYARAGDVRHLERAVGLFRRYATEAPDGRRHADARDALTELEPELERVKPGVSATAPRAAPGPAPAPRPTRLMLVAEAHGALISIDGEPVAASPLVREVAPGRHHVRASAPGYAVLERETTAFANEVVLNELTLSELPSVVSVYTPPNTDLYVNGVLAGESPGRFQLELPAGEHRIAASLKGHELETHRVRLARGQALNLRFSPEKSTQRIVSEILFCAGGAAVGGGLVLSGFAVRSENDAEDFLAARRAHSVTPSALLAYQASLNERDGFRLAATVSFASAIGLFVTGMFLHELDRPVASERRQTLSPHGAASGSDRASLELELLPFARGADAGSSLRVVF